MRNFRIIRFFSSSFMKMHRNNNNNSSNTNSWSNITGTRFQPPTRQHCTFQLCDALHRNRWIEGFFLFVHICRVRTRISVVGADFFFLFFSFECCAFFPLARVPLLVPIKSWTFCCSLALFPISFFAFRINAVIEHQSDSHKITTFNLQRVFKQEKMVEAVI